MQTPGIFWLTRDFRFADNPALLAASVDGPLLAVFIIDRALMAQGAASRWRLERALGNFDTELRRRTGGVGVTLLRGEADEVLPPLLESTGARRVHQSDWPAPAMRAVQERVHDALRPMGGELQLHGGHLLVHPRLIRTQQGESYRVFTPFARALRAIGPDRPAPPVPDRITPYVPQPEGLDLTTIDLAPDLHRGRTVLERFALPVGEVAAHARLSAFLERVAGYASDRDRPDLEATSGLSEHLALGEISPRSLWHIAMACARPDDPAQAGEIAKFLSEVIWREFAWHLLIDFPHLPDAPWRADWARFDWRGESDALTRWCRGETGVALIDAGLREMRVTGRMHNRVRMVAASWLTKHLLTDWRLGLRHFAESLTDWDPASNAMNWQWVAGCGPDAAPFFRIFNPETQAVRFDPEARYRRLWLAGWHGKTTEAAQAYLDSTPPSWNLSPVWQPNHRAALADGRERALAAYARFRVSII